MLINLCDNYYNTKVRCDKPSTDGYEVSNLLINNSPGFLTYSAINPPINIDFKFICNVKLSHILIWPCVGSQKSTGFKLSTITHRQQQSHNLLFSGFLNENHTGILFTTKYVNNINSIAISDNFLKVIMHRSSKTLCTVDNLRVSIVKTNRSVPALSRIEIWGYISLFHNEFNNANKVLTSFMKHEISSVQITSNKTDDEIISQPSIETPKSLTIPEEFLDPITWTLMLQPIILPSGKVIDQSTLEHFGKNEALWGRPLSDPFTGITLNNDYKPIFASQLKLRIDKFLSDNSDDSEIKKLPRILGHGNTSNEPLYYLSGQQKIFDVESKQEKLVKSLSDVSIRKINYLNKSTMHKLPIISQYSRKILRNNMNKMPGKISTITKTTISKIDNNDTLDINCKIDEKLRDNLQSILSNLKRFNDTKVKDKITIMKEHICNCCEFPIFYKLLCNHIVCRKIILSQNDKKNNDGKGNLQCPRCNLSCKLSEIIKFHY